MRTDRQGPDGWQQRQPCEKPAAVFLLNLNDVTLMSEALDQSFKLRISAAALRTVDHRGGLDAFLAKAKDADLSPRARRSRKTSQQAVAAA